LDTDTIKIVAALMHDDGHRVLLDRRLAL